VRDGASPKGEGGHPSRGGGPKAERDGREAELTAAGQEFEILRDERREKEREVEEERAKVEKAKEKLMAIKTQKEYVAMLKEIDQTKRGNSVRVEQLLVLMQRFEESEKRLAECRASFGEAEGRYRERMVEVEARMASFDGEIALLEGKKKGVAKGLEAGLLRRFETIFERREGKAIVAARNQSCTGCHMNLSPQLFNQLRQNDRVHSCPNCNRLLYFEGIPEGGDGQA
jgi:predicted  nucleic acid-binding Zn-ribbon protein